jgi:hypothetical protein
MPSPGAAKIIKAVDYRRISFDLSARPTFVPAADSTV